MEPRTGASHPPQQADPRLICNPSASWKLSGRKVGQIFPGVVPNPDLIQAYQPPVSPCRQFPVFSRVGQGSMV